MGLKSQLDTDLKAAMKAREPLRVETIRAVRGAFKNKEIELGSEEEKAEAKKIYEEVVASQWTGIERALAYPEAKKKAKSL